MKEFHKHTSYTVCPYKPQTCLNFHAIVRKTPIIVSIFFRTVREAVAAGAVGFRTKAARRRVDSHSYGDGVRNLNLGPPNPWI